MIAVITDTHLTNDTIEVNKSIFRQSIEECQKRGITRLYHNGDFLTSRKSMSMSEQNALDEIIGMFEASGVELVAITGNHDIKSDESNVKKSWLRPYRYHPYFKLVETSQAFDEVMFNVTAIPFMAPELMMEVLEHTSEHLDKTRKNVLLIHQEVYGSVNNDGKPINNGIPINAFDAFDLVLCGHFHNRQQITSNIWYMGSAYAGNFGEDNEKGLTIINDDLSLEFVPLSFKKYITVPVDMDGTTKKKLDLTIKEWANNENNVRFVFSGSESLVKAIDFDILKSVGIQYTMKAKKVSVDENGVEEKVEETIVYDRNNIPTEFDAFCNEKEIPAESKTKYGDKYLMNRLSKVNN